MRWLDFSIHVDPRSGVGPGHVSLLLVCGFNAIEIVMQILMLVDSYIATADSTRLTR